MPIFSWRIGRIVEVGTSPEGDATLLAVGTSAVWIPPAEARKVAAALVAFADRQDGGEMHPMQDITTFVGGEH